MSERLLSVSCIVGSAALHAALAFGMHAAPPRAPEPPPVLLDLALPEPPPPEPLPPEPPPAQPEPVAAKVPVVAKLPEPVAKPPEPEPPQPMPMPNEPPPSEPPATIASDQSTPWTMAQGSGEARGGAVLAASRRSPAPLVQPPVAPPPLPEALPLAQLSKRPVPPALEHALRHNYPARARRQGLSGEAKVRARIEASGQVSTATINFETSPGFGEACQRTLLTSRWSAPLDARGRAVATWVTYRCKFRIDD